MLQELLPAMRRVAVIWNAANPYPALVLKNIQAAVLPIGIDVQRWKSDHWTTSQT
jgi:hypothetical protein